MLVHPSLCRFVELVIAEGWSSRCAESITTSIVLSCARCVPVAQLTSVAEPKICRINLLPVSEVWVNVEQCNMSQMSQPTTVQSVSSVGMVRATSIVQ
eukprot:826798-Amphidinium_carterae.1